ncbi:hypothetical protein [Chitinibacter sp. S2-10]|uniref:hypothetical protein n=1 Tax=Chitinibacter sp. S2-10 TaxID=3373597 RepID=UPI003977A4AF
MNTSDYALLAGAAYDKSRSDVNKIPLPDGFIEPRHHTNETATLAVFLCLLSLI